MPSISKENRIALIERLYYEIFHIITTNGGKWPRGKELSNYTNIIDTDLREAVKDLTLGEWKRCVFAKLNEYNDKRKKARQAEQKQDAEPVATAEPAPKQTQTTIDFDASDICQAANNIVAELQRIGNILQDIFDLTYANSEIVI